MKFPDRRYLAGLALLAAFTLAGCGGGPATDSPVSSHTQVSLTLSPAAVFATGVDATVTLTVNGGTVTSTSQVVSNGTALSTVSQNGSKIQVTVPGSLLESAGTVPLSVTDGTPGDPALGTTNLTAMAPGTVETTTNPQVAKYSAILPPGAKIAVEFGPTTSYGLQTWQRPAPSSGGETDILVAGMRALTTYHLRAQVTLADGSVVEGPDHSFTTQGPLDSALPTFAATTTGSPSPGIEEVNAASVLHGQAMITDLAGNILWNYEEMDPTVGWVFCYRLLPDGDMLVLVSDYKSTSAIREVDLTGATVRELTMASLNAQLKNQGADFQFTFLDHDILPLANGHILVLGSVNKDFQNLPGYPGTTTVQGNAIVDLDQNFVPVWTWNAFDRLDVNRHPMLFPDWLHANALLYTADGNILLSIRHQNWIVKIDYANGQGNGGILWRLGYQGDFTLAGGDPSQWFYAQHMPTIVSENGSQMTLAVFDDGNDRVTDAQGDVCGTGTQPACYSRAVLIKLDQSAKTASVVWDYKPGLYTPWGGNAEVLENGDVELDLSQPFTTNKDGEVMEVTTTASPQVVWQMILSENMYRAYRIPSLYPGVQW